MGTNVDLFNIISLSTLLTLITFKHVPTGTNVGFFKFIFINLSTLLNFISFKHLTLLQIYVALWGSWCVCGHRHTLVNVPNIKTK